MKNKFGRLIATTILVLFFILILNPYGMIRGKRIGSNDLHRVLPETFYIQPSYVVEVSRDNSDKNFHVFIPPWRIPNNSTSIPDNIYEEKVNLPLSELPFGNQKKAVLNVNYIDGTGVGRQDALKTEILSQSISEQLLLGSGRELVQVYDLELKLPDNFDVRLQKSINQREYTNNYELTNYIENIGLVIKEDYVIEKGSEKFVCKVIKIKEALSMDYQYYRVKAKLVPITVSSTKTFEKYNGPESFVYISSGLNKDDKVVKPTIIPSCRIK